MWSCVLCKTTSAGTGFQISHFLSYVSRIPKPRIPDPISKNFPDSGLYKQKFSSILDFTSKNFPRLRIVQANIFPIPDCTSKNFLDFGIRIPFHGANDLLTCYFKVWKMDLFYIDSSSGSVESQKMTHISFVLMSFNRDHFKRKWRDKVTDSCTHN